MLEEGGKEMEVEIGIAMQVINAWNFFVYKQVTLWSIQSTLVLSFPLLPVGTKTPSR